MIYVSFLGIFQHDLSMFQLACISVLFWSTNQLTKPKMNIAGSYEDGAGSSHQAGAPYRREKSCPR